jgi:septal ring factor EnvC (AmiA/AmiB activator)
MKIHRLIYKYIARIFFGTIEKEIMADFASIFLAIFNSVVAIFAKKNEKIDELNSQLVDALSRLEASMQLNVELQAKVDLLEGEVNVKSEALAELEVKLQVSSDQKAVIEADFQEYKSEDELQDNALLSAFESAKTYLAQIEPPVEVPPSEAPVE